MGVLANRSYRNLFTAQVVALVGTGLCTVALGLMAYRLAGDQAGAVLGTALAIKMVAYVLIAPVATALTDRFSRRVVLVSLDLVRVAVAACLPWVSTVWQVYALIALLQVASAAFTPTFQATIPTVVPDERDYTEALSLSRVAYELECLLSPALAAVLLTVLSSEQLFWATAIGFAGSAALVAAVVLPRPEPVDSPGGLVARSTWGLRIYLATPRLRGLLGLNLATSAAGAMVLVNTVVVVRGELESSEIAVAATLGVYGGGALLVALVLPSLLERISDRKLMLFGGAALGGLLATGALLLSVVPETGRWPVVLGAWLLLGMAGAVVQTPIGRLIRRSGHDRDLPALFAAQFTLSHACWLLTYLLAGALGATAGTVSALAALAVVATCGVLVAARWWPSRDAEVLDHVHHDLAPDDPHLCDAEPIGTGWRHRHTFVIDRAHPRWPSHG